MIIFCLYNKTLKQFYSPLVDYNVAGIKRSLFDVVNDKGDNLIKLCPANYAVYEIGTFDAEKGTINARKKPELLFECTELKEVTSD